MPIYYLKKTVYLLSLIFITAVVLSCESTYYNANTAKNYLSNETFPALVIDFLSVKEAESAILEEFYEPYFSKLELREIEAILGQKPPSKNLEEARDFARLKFSSAVLEYTLEEQACISAVLNIVSSVFQKEGLTLFVEQPWKFIKSENWLCGGFAFTREDYIVISQRYLDKLTSGWGKDNSTEAMQALVQNMGGLLVHEQLHSLQRRFPEKFESLYQDYWSFIKIEVPADTSLAMNQITNPDAPTPEWAFEHESKLFWVRTLIESKSNPPVMGRDFKDLVFTLEEKGGHYIMKRDSLGYIINTEREHLHVYNDCFPVTNGLDHPNEISAYMFSEYLKSLLANEKPFANCQEAAEKNSLKFVEWIELNLN